MLRAVLFDLDDTLIARTEAFLACLRESVIESRHRALLRQLDARGRGCRDTLFALWREVTGEPMDQELLGLRLSAHLGRDSGLLGYLGQVSASYQIALVTNGGSLTQRRKLKATALDTVFAAERIWISAEWGMAKPDPGLLLRACQALAVRPRECLFVGDRDDEDGAAAQAAGMPYLRVDLPVVLPLPQHLGALHARRLWEVSG